MNRLKQIIIADSHRYKRKAFKKNYTTVYFINYTRVLCL